jgi:hypothetical protein
VSHCISGTISKRGCCIGIEMMWDSIVLHKEKRKLLLIQTWALLVADNEAECETRKRLCRTHAAALSPIESLSRDMYCVS